MHNRRLERCIESNESMGCCEWSKFGVRRRRRRRNSNKDKFGTPPQQHITEGLLPAAKIVQGCDRLVECGGVEWVSRCG